MQDIIKLQQKIVPEMLQLLEKRYDILRTIYYNQPIGRRILANSMGIGERIVRTEINFLKDQKLININTGGMNITSEGEEIIDKLKDFIHEIKGLTEIENVIKNRFNLKHVVIVPGDLEEDKSVMNELGRVAANYLRDVIKNNDIIALTGGTTIKEVVDNVPKISNLRNILVVPARGGIGKNLETQANNLAASLANKIGANYKLLHVPDNLSDNALNTILNEKDIKDVIDSIHNSNVLVYGIGRADEMGRRRGIPQEKLKNLDDEGAVGEAFGYYFNKKGEILYSTTTIGIRNKDINNIETRIAIAGGKSKAEAIIGIEANNSNSVLIIDEGAAREIMRFLKE